MRDDLNHWRVNHWLDTIEPVIEHLRSNRPYIRADKFAEILKLMDYSGDRSRCPCCARPLNEDGETND
jgi:hypothetical protein